MNMMLLFDACPLQQLVSIWRISSA